MVAPERLAGVDRRLVHQILALPSAGARCSSQGLQARLALRPVPARAAVQCSAPAVVALVVAKNLRRDGPLSASLS